MEKDACVCPSSHRKTTHHLSIELLAVSFEEECNWLELYLLISQSLSVAFWELKLVLVPSYAHFPSYMPKSKVTIWVKKNTVQRLARSVNPAFLNHDINHLLPSLQGIS